MKYITLVIRYEDDEKIPVPELDDKILGGEVTHTALYDISRVANVAVNALDNDFDDGAIEEITGIISGHL